MSALATKMESPTDAAKHIPGVVVGLIAGESDDRRPLVHWGGQQGAQVATALWMEDPPKWSGCIGLRVVVGFENGDETRPLLLGLLDAPQRVDIAVAAADGEEKAVRPLKPKVLRIESEQELILECGEAKIALRADGRIVILGGYVLSRSKGVNRIKGGSVQIN